MVGLRTETKARARALQLLYAWEVRGGPEMSKLANDLLALGRGVVPGSDRAEELARGVVAEQDWLDREIESAVEGWRLERMGIIEKNILRIALFELRNDPTPPRVVLDEAVRLAHWFAGPKAPAFVNGVLDALARRQGRL